MRQRERERKKEREREREREGRWRRTVEKDTENKQGHYILYAKYNYIAQIIE